MSEEKEWKIIEINGFKTNYACSTDGDIGKLSLKSTNACEIDHFLKSAYAGAGYRKVSLSIDGKVYQRYVHQLVANAFIEYPKDIDKDLLEVNHKDGNRSNNKVTNLEWVTSSENKIHAYRTGLSKRGEKNSHAIYSDDQIHEVCKYLEENVLKPSAISEITGVKKSVIMDIRNHGSWEHISSLYDFSKYRAKQKVYPDATISKLTHLIRTTNLSPKRLSELTGVKKRTVYYYKDKVKHESI